MVARSPPNWNNLLVFRTYTRHSISEVKLLLTRCRYAAVNELSFPEHNRLWIRSPSLQGDFRRGLLFLLTNSPVCMQVVRAQLRVSPRTERKISPIMISSTNVARVNRGFCQALFSIYSSDERTSRVWVMLIYVAGIQYLVATELRVVVEKLNEMLRNMSYDGSVVGAVGW